MISQFSAQKVDMFIGSFVDIGFGTAYVLKIDEDGYQQASSVAQTTCTSNACSSQSIS